MAGIVISEGARNYAWPSIQRDSEILSQRIAPELRLRLLRKQLAAQFERLDRLEQRKRAA